MTNAKTVNKAGLHYTKDEFGKEVLLKDSFLQVVMEWEKPAIRACIELLKPKGDVLEVGFGLGYSATAIAEAKPKSHTIIESDPAVVKKAKEWAANRPNVKIIEDSWQNAVTKLGTFDFIFFDDYCPISKDEFHQLQQDTATCEELTEGIQQLHANLAAALEQFKGVRFSDQQLKEFQESVLNKPNVNIKQITNFIERLEHQGNISTKQKNDFLKNLQHDAKGKIPEEGPAVSPISIDALNRKELSYHFIQFVELCTNKLMRPGSKLASLFYTLDSAKDHANFQQKILSKKDLIVTEKAIPVQVPDNCLYYQGNKALILIIEKK